MDYFAREGKSHHRHSREIGSPRRRFTPSRLDTIIAVPRRDAAFEVRKADDGPARVPFPRRCTKARTTA
jgi:hypothetical protein